MLTTGHQTQHIIQTTSFSGVTLPFLLGVREGSLLQNTKIAYDSSLFFQILGNLVEFLLWKPEVSLQPLGKISKRFTERKINVSVCSCSEAPKDNFISAGCSQSWRGGAAMRQIAPQPFRQLSSPAWTTQHPTSIVVPTRVYLFFTPGWLAQGGLC